MKPDVKGQTWWVIGLARSGCAAGALLRRHGAQVIGIDDNDEKTVHRRWERESLSLLAPRAFDELATGGTWPSQHPDAVVISPGVPPSHPRLKALPAQIPVMGEMELGASFCKADLVAITGTNGKSTTTELIAHLVRKSGRRVEALGNLGTPLSQIADELPSEAVVSLEVSSFQLESVVDFSPRVGMVLNLAPDHLDRYPDLAAYYRAKQVMAQRTAPGGHFITWTECPEARTWSTKSSKLLFGIESAGADVFFRNGVLCFDRAGETVRLLAADDFALQSPPNLLNALAAAAAGLALGLDDEAMADGLKDFPGLAHRQQWVASLDNVRYINDTKATNVHAVCAGLDGYGRSVALIVGGSGKGESYEPLKKVMKSVVHVVTIGDEGPFMGTVLADVVPVTAARDMNEAVKVATDKLCEAQPAAGGDVMLSPACASFDMFASYRHRGEAFVAAALDLGAKAREVAGE
jgi:UDP-N-acetylmuramoylalanine--D-glutamate ligase